MRERSAAAEEQVGQQKKEATRLRAELSQKVGARGLLLARCCWCYTCCERCVVKTGVTRVFVHSCSFFFAAIRSISFRFISSLPAEMYAFAQESLLQQLKQDVAQLEASLAVSRKDQAKDDDEPRSGLLRTPPGQSHGQQACRW